MLNLCDLCHLSWMVSALLVKKNNCQCQWSSASQDILQDRLLIIKIDCIASTFQIYRDVDEQDCKFMLLEKFRMFFDLINQFVYWDSVKGPCLP